MLMTCALSCATKFDMDKALLKRHCQGNKKTPTIHVIVNVVASDIPSVKNSTITVKRRQLTLQRSHAHGCGCTAWPRCRLLHQHQIKSEVSDLLVVIGRDLSARVL